MYTLADFEWVLYLEWCCFVRSIYEIAIYIYIYKIQIIFLNYICLKLAKSLSNYILVLYLRQVGHRFIKYYSCLKNQLFWLFLSFYCLVEEGNKCCQDDLLSTQHKAKFRSSISLRSGLSVAKPGLSQTLLYRRTKRHQ